MKNTLYFLYVLIVSPEYIVIFGAMIIVAFFPISDEWLAKNITVSSDALRYLALLPVIIASWVIKESRKLIFPNDEINGILHKWEGYWELKIHFYVAVFYSLLFSIASLIPWILGIETLKFYSFMLILTSIVGSLVLAFTVFKARVDLDEIVEKIKKL